MKLTCMRGYSGSGKSHKAREIAKETGAVIVNRDYLRKMLLGEWWTGHPQDEQSVTIAEENLVGDFLTAGNDVIVDATHLNPRYLRRWAKLATKLGAEFEVVDVTTPIEDCVINDMVRQERTVGINVIHQQAKRFPQANWPTITAEQIHVEPYVPPEHGYEAIIVDIDGTLAHMNGRSPYDYTRVSEDTIDEDVRLIVNATGEKVDQTIILSGRDSCYDDTYHWLIDNGVKFDRLLMRPADAKDAKGNKLPDWIVKLNLFNEHIRDHYRVRAVFDDRLQVCEMWHKLGLKLLRVGDPNANF